MSGLSQGSTLWPILFNLLMTRVAPPYGLSVVCPDHSCAEKALGVLGEIKWHMTQQCALAL